MPEPKKTNKSSCGLCAALGNPPPCKGHGVTGGGKEDVKDEKATQESGKQFLDNFLGKDNLKIFDLGLLSISIDRMSGLITFTDRTDPSLTDEEKEFTSRYREAVLKQIEDLIVDPLDGNIAKDETSIALKINDPNKFNLFIGRLSETNLINTPNRVEFDWKLDPESKDHPNDKIQIEVLGESADEPGKLLVQITYIPDPNLKREDVSFGYRNELGDGVRDVPPMTQLANGSWQGTRTMYPNESSELCLFRSPINPEKGPEFSGPDHFKTKICLFDGRLVSEVYPDLSLGDEQKGTIETWTQDSNGTLHNPSDKTKGEYLVHVYYPPGYDSAQTYPVHVMLDGDMHFATDKLGNCLDTPAILDNLINKDKIEPVVAVFCPPTPFVEEGGKTYMPRLREYGCDMETAERLASLPKNLKENGVNVQTDHAAISGASMGGLQSLYTAKTHPDVFDHVIAQSPAVWWSPPEKTPEKTKTLVLYNEDPGWRASVKFNAFPETPLSNEDRKKMEHQPYRGFVHELFERGKDTRPGGKELPEGHDKIKIELQVGRNENGTIRLDVGKEPLTQATITLSKKHDIPCKVLDTAHIPEAWSCGLVEALPKVHPKLSEELTVRQEAKSTTAAAFENRVREMRSKSESLLSEPKPPSPGRKNTF